MKQIIIHIGAPKTASTAIQSMLKNNQSLLEKQGILAPAWLNFENQWQLAASLNYPKGGYFVEVAKYIPINKYSDFSEQRIERFHTELKSFIDSENLNTLIISSENLFHIQVHALNKLNDILIGYVADVKVVMFYRDHEAMLKSAYAQAVKGPNMEVRTYDEYVEASFKKTLFDFYPAYNLWKSNIQNREIKLFEMSRSSGLNPMILFSDFIGIDQKDLVMKSESNVSPTYFQVKLIRIINIIFKKLFDNIHYSSLALRLARKMVSIIPIAGSYPIKTSKYIKERYKNDLTMIKNESLKK